ncbi:Metallo-dependent phosphatase-like protein [Aspergillus keveii]|uniref:Metallo-dependent phosphatase-like protein n=1 Tax=Aspergillus keveii TaxID=714993 RepID=A0ABR4GDN2_9EURO
MKTKTRLLLLSDTHTLPPSPPTFQTTPYRHPLPAAQILLHAGDITKVGLRREHTFILSSLASHPAELKIVIAGNHDITLDEEYYTRLGWRRHRFVSDHLSALPSASSGENGGGNGKLEDPREIKSLYTSDEARRAGIVYMEEEVRTFVLPSTGARFTVYASPYTPEFCQWAFAYPRNVDRFNPPDTSHTASLGSPNTVQSGQNLEGNANGRGGVYVPSYPGVDILLTHGPPYGILDQVIGSRESVGCKHLYRAVERARPALHVFGHIHEGYGARRVEWEGQPGSLGSGSGSGRRREEEVAWDRETVMEERCAYVDLSSRSERPLRRGEETLFVNASVVNVEYKPLNAPWVVDLDLDLEVQEGGEDVEMST